MPTLALVLAQYDDTDLTPSEAALTGFFLIFLLIALVMVIVVAAARWTLFKKAGQPGWAAIVPIYKWVVTLKVINRPLGWVLLLFVPGVGLVALFIMNVELAKAFGKDTVFGVGMTLVGVVFYPLLAWGNTTYDPSRLPAAAPA